MASTRYRLAPSVIWQLAGIALIVVALVVGFATAVVAWRDLPVSLIVTVAALGVLGVSGAAWWAARWAWVVRATDTGYQVRGVRGVGVSAARWKDVEDAVTTEVRGAPCLLLRLRDGRTTTIPVQMVAMSADRFVRAMQEHLQQGNGLRRL